MKAHPKIKKHETLSLWNGGTKIMQISIREALLQDMNWHTDNIISILHFLRKRKLLNKLNQLLISKLVCNDLAIVQWIIDHSEQQKQIETFRFTNNCDILLRTSFR